MVSIYNSSGHDDLAALTSRYVPAAMSLNGTAYLGGGVLILTKTLTGESVEVIDEPKANKTTDIIDVKIVQVAFCILYTIIFVLGVFGNVLVCYVVFRNRAMQTVTNLFITNLALSDILLCIFAVPLTPMYTFLGRWVFGRLLCHLMPYAQAICYTCVSIRLNDRARSKPGAKNTRREEADRDRKRRTNRMLISMVAIFGISWLPLNLINIFNDFYAQMTEWNYYFVSFFLAHSMAMASTCYNPFLYAWLNENFRKEFKQVLPFFESTGGVRNSYHSGRMPTHKADKICNGNDTIQETLLASSFNRGPSIKQRILEGNGKKDNGVEVENIILEDKVLSATYHTKSENVNLQLIDEESQQSETRETKSPM
ncbi:unnamed protein product [Spodoptera exigua]|nr:unnamed protein product [Spodoptera exigua]